MLKTDIYDWLTEVISSAKASRAESIHIYYSDNPTLKHIEVLKLDRMIAHDFGSRKVKPSGILGLNGAVSWMIMS